MTIVHDYNDTIVYEAQSYLIAQEILLQSALVWHSVMFITSIFFQIVRIIHLVIVTRSGSNWLQITFETAMLEKILNLNKLTTHIDHQSVLVRAKYELRPHMCKVEITEKTHVSMPATTTGLISKSILVDAISIHVDKIKHVFVYRTIRSDVNELLIFVNRYAWNLLRTHLRDAWCLIRIDADYLFRSTNLTQSTR